MGLKTISTQRFLLSAVTSIGIFFCSFSFAQTKALPASRTVFDLKKTVQFAIENSPAFDSPKRELDIATLEEKSAFARQLPSLDLTATHGPQEDSVPGTLASRTKSEFILGLSESLYDNGVTQTNYQIAKIKKQQAELVFENQRNKLSLAVVNAFIKYSLAVKLVEIQEKQFNLIRKQYELISKNYHEGLKTKKDYLRFKTQVSRGEINLLNARSNIETSKQELIRLIRAGVSKETAVFEFQPLSFELQPTDLSNSEISVENHKEFAAAQLQKQVNNLTADLTRRKYWPEWHITAGASYSSADYLNTGKSFEDNDRWGWNALLTVKYNFLDWGIRSRDRQVAQLRNSVQDNLLETQMLTLQSDINQLQINLQQMQKNYGLAKELFALETSNIQLIEREYRNGQVAYLDLITGLQDLSDSQVKFFTASADLQSARYNLLFHQGSLYENLIK